MNKLFPLFVIIVLISSCKNVENQNTNRTIIKTSLVRSIIEENEKNFTFITQPHHKTSLSFRISGPIGHLNVYPGTYFDKGDVISEVDPRDFIIRQERAKGVYNQAKSEYERIKILFEKDNVSASTYEKTYSEYIAAKTTYETVNNELNDTKLVSPYNGYIDQVYVEQYQEIKATQPIVSFVSIDSIKIEVYVTHQIAINKDNIKSVNIKLDDIHDKIFNAKVIEISKNTTYNNLSYLLTALIPNKDHSLLPGMSGSIIFDNYNTNKILSVPQASISYRPNIGEYVWCIKNGRSHMRKVKTGNLIANDNIEILEGLEIGEEVAISGLRFLSNNLEVEIR